MRYKDLLQILMLGATGALAINAYSVFPQRTLIFGGIYFFLLVLISFETVKSREARDRVQAEVVWGLFSHMNREIFHDDHGTRFTLFVPSPLRPGYIVPWYRFRKGASDPIGDAQGSRARYKRAEGFTGLAWDNPGDLFCGSFRVFSTRSDFETYYVDTLGIDAVTARELSDFMQHVRTIFTYGITDSRGKLLGVLSLDMQKPLSGKEEQDDDDPTFRVDRAEIDTLQMALIVRSMKSVLESFSTILRR